jgi:hypothetical protein
MEAVTNEPKHSITNLTFLTILAVFMVCTFDLSILPLAIKEKE